MFFGVLWNWLFFGRGPRIAKCGNFFSVGWGGGHWVAIFGKTRKVELELEGNGIKWGNIGEML